MHSNSSVDGDAKLVATLQQPCNYALSLSILQLEGRRCKRMAYEIQGKATSLPNAYNTKEYSKKYLSGIKKEDILALLRKNIMVCIPYITDPEHLRIPIFYRANKYVRNQNKPEELAILFDLFFNVLCMREIVRDRGILMLVDMDGWSFWNNYDSVGTKIGVEACTKRIPFPLTKQILVNPPTWINKLMKLVGYFTPPELMKQFDFVAASGIKKYFDEETLAKIPAEFGGTCNDSSFTNEEFIKRYSKEIEQYASLSSDNNN